MTDKPDMNYVADIMALTDKDIIEELGLDPNLKGTKEINAAALEQTIIKLRANLEKLGEKPEAIDDYVKDARNAVLTQIKAAEKRTGKKLL